MAGIQRLKDAVKFGVKLTEGVISKLDDKKLTFIEALGLVPDLVDLPGLIRDSEVLWSELNDIDAAERQELLQYVKDELDVDNDKVEVVVESALTVVSAIAGLAFDIKALKDKDEE